MLYYIIRKYNSKYIFAHMSILEHIMSISDTSNVLLSGIYDLSDETIPEIIRIFTPDSQFIEFGEPNSGWCHMRIGSIGIPSVSYLTDPLFDAMEMIANLFNHGDGTLQIDHEGDTTEISMSGITDSLIGRSVKVKIATGYGERSLTNIVSYDAIFVSIYGLVASLSDNLADWAEWGSPDTDDDRQDAIDAYVDAAKRMIAAASNLLDKRRDDNEYDDETGGARYEYVKNVVDVSSQLIDMIEKQQK